MAGTLQHGGTLPPVPLPRLNLQAQFGMGGGRGGSTVGMRPLDNSSSSEEEDKVDLLGRSFQVPRPKSRSNASIAVSRGWSVALVSEICVSDLVVAVITFLMSQQDRKKSAFRQTKTIERVSNSFYFQL